MMGSRSSRNMILAGILGAMAGMYLMSTMDSRIERQVRYKGRRIMRSAKTGASRLGSMYAASKSAIQNSMDMIRH